MRVLQLARAAGRRFGVDVRRYRPKAEAGRASPKSDAFQRLTALLSRRGVACVLDVGANRGQYARHLIEAGYAGEIVSFEPLPDAHAALAEAASAHARWRAAPRLALSDEDGEARFMVAGNSVSSSLLGMEPAHWMAAPESAPSGEISVPTRRLDGMWGELGLSGPVFLKIDAQGSESLVLAGATRRLADVVGVQLEMSLIPLYQGQALAHELDALLRGRGFRCVDLIPGFRRPETFELLQYDGVYVRDD